MPKHLRERSLGGRPRAIGVSAVEAEVLLESSANVDMEAQPVFFDRAEVVGLRLAPSKSSCTFWSMESNKASYLQYYS